MTTVKVDSVNECWVPRKACRGVQVQMKERVSAVDAKDQSRVLVGIVRAVVVVMEECGVEEDSCARTGE
jgi:hypothetical protein